MSDGALRIHALGFSLASVTRYHLHDVMVQELIWLSSNEDALVKSYKALEGNFLHSDFGFDEDIDIITLMRSLVVCYFCDSLKLLVVLTLFHQEKYKPKESETILTSLRDVEANGEHTPWHLF